MALSLFERHVTPPEFDYESFELPPKVAMTFRLQNHGSEADLPSPNDLGTEIRSYDGVIVEYVFDDPRLVGAFSKIAKGSVKDYAYVREKHTRFADNGHDLATWINALSSSLYASRVGVADVDIRADHKSLRKIDTAMKVIGPKILIARSDEDILKLKPYQIAYHEAQHDRDQYILENIAPAIGALAATHNAFNPTRQDRPASLLAFFGNEHRSLVDALLHKQSTNPAEGFSVDIHSESSLDDPKEELYARFLRGMEIPDQLLIERMALTALSAALATGGYIDIRKTPSFEIDRLCARIARDRSFAEVNTIRQKLNSGNYKIVIPDEPDQPVDIVNNNPVAVFVKNPF